MPLKPSRMDCFNFRIGLRLLASFFIKFQIFLLLLNHFNAKNVNLLFKSPIKPSNNHSIFNRPIKPSKSPQNNLLHSSHSRIGRGGRFGRKGVAINFITDADRRALQELEQHYHTTIEEMPCNVADLI